MMDARRSEAIARYIGNARKAIAYQHRSTVQYRISRDMRECSDDPLSVALAIYHAQRAAILSAAAREYLNTAIFWKAQL